MQAADAVEVFPPHTPELKDGSYWIPVSIVWHHNVGLNLQSIASVLFMTAGITGLIWLFCCVFNSRTDCDLNPLSVKPVHSRMDSVQYASWVTFVGGHVCLLLVSKLWELQEDPILSLVSLWTKLCALLQMDCRENKTTWLCSRYKNSKTPKPYFSSERRKQEHD